MFFTNNKNRMLTDDEDEKYENYMVCDNIKSIEHKGIMERGGKQLSSLQRAQKNHRIISLHKNQNVERITYHNGRPVVDHTYRDHFHDPNLEDVVNLHSIKTKTKRNLIAVIDEVLSNPGSISNNLDNIKIKSKTLAQSVISTPRLARGGVTIAFPEKLHEMLTQVADENIDDIISWQPHGRCFLIHKKESFVERIMPRSVLFRL